MIVEKLPPEEPKFQITATRRELEYILHAVCSLSSADDEAEAFHDVADKVWAALRQY